MAYALDTSGTVHADDGKYIAAGGQLYLGVGWGILSPFAQGYVEALFADEGGVLSLLLERYAHEGVQVRFDDLAPETLARIVADCDRRENDRGRKYRHDGAAFWANRQAGRARDFLPLTVQLGDDGKVRFAEAQKEA